MNESLSLNELITKVSENPAFHVILTNVYNQLDPVAFTWGPFHRGFGIYQSIKCDRNLHMWNSNHSNMRHGLCFVNLDISSLFDLLCIMCITDLYYIRLYYNVSSVHLVYWLRLNMNKWMIYKINAHKTSALLPYIVLWLCCVYTL